VTIDVFRTGAKSYGRNRLVDQARISVEDGLVGLTFTSNPEGAN